MSTTSTIIFNDPLTGETAKLTLQVREAGGVLSAKWTGSRSLRHRLSVNLPTVADKQLAEDYTAILLGNARSLGITVSRSRSGPPPPPFDELLPP